MREKVLKKIKEIKAQEEKKERKEEKKEGKGKGKEKEKEKEKKEKWGMNIWGSLGEMWGENSVSVRKESELGRLQEEILLWLGEWGYVMNNRPPHISVMYKKKKEKE